MEQEQNARLGFFRRMFLAVTDFRLYPFVQREKVKVATSYFTLLLALVTVFLALSFSNRFFDNVSELLNVYDEKIPEFTLKDGTLDVTEKIYNMDGDFRFVVDTYMSSEEFANTETGKEVLYSNSFTVINSNGAVFGSEDATFIILFKGIKGEITKDNLREFLIMANEDKTVKAAIVSVTWLALFIAYFIIKMINVLFLILMAWILNILFGMKLKFSNYYRIVVYALTLPLIIELVSILYLGRVPEYATIAYQLLAYVYIFYALRALKLDILIISAPGTNFREKIENMIQKIENDVEEKVKKEAEDENKQDDKKDEDKKDE